MEMRTEGSNVATWIVGQRDENAFRGFVGDRGDIYRGEEMPLD